MRGKGCASQPYNTGRKNEVLNLGGGDLGDILLRNVGAFGPFVFPVPLDDNSRHARARHRIGTRLDGDHFSRDRRVNRHGDKPLRLTHHLAGQDPITLGHRRRTRRTDMLRHQENGLIGQRKPDDLGVARPLLGVAGMNTPSKCFCHAQKSPSWPFSVLTVNGPGPLCVSRCPQSEIPDESVARPVGAVSCFPRGPDARSLRPPCRIQRPARRRHGPFPSGQRRT